MNIVTAVTGRVVGVNRYRVNTVNGNPRLAVRVETDDPRWADRWIRLADDVSLVHEISNDVYVLEPHTFMLRDGLIVRVVASSEQVSA